jgi:hypothetical protein
MMQKAPTSTVETPQTEPEIIPPGANLRSASRMYDWMREPQPKGTFRPLRTAKETFIAAA